jgi:hypothetical protein
MTAARGRFSFEFDVSSRVGTLHLMTASEALASIKGFAAANRIRLVLHALDRASQRGATYRDVRSALMNATVCIANAQREGSWRVSGEDLDGDELTCVCVIESGVVVITLF